MSGDPTLVTNAHIIRLLIACNETRYPRRNRVIVLLAFEAGLTPLEMSWLKRYAVETDGSTVGSHIDLEGKKGSNLVARRIPLSEGGRLKGALLDHLHNTPGHSMDPVIVSERALDGGGAVSDPNEGPLSPMRPTSISYVVYKLCEKASIRIEGVRDIRKSFMTMVSRAMRDDPQTNARDIQQLCGHRSLETTQRFIDADWDAQNKVIGTLFDRA